MRCVMGYGYIKTNINAVKFDCVKDKEKIIFKGKTGRFSPSAIIVVKIPSPDFREAPNPPVRRRVSHPG